MGTSTECKAQQEPFAPDDPFLSHDCAALPADVMGTKNGPMGRGQPIFKAGTYKCPWRSRRQGRRNTLARRVHLYRQIKERQAGLVGERMVRFRCVCGGEGSARVQLAQATQRAIRLQGRKASAPAPGKEPRTDPAASTKCRPGVMEVTMEYSGGGCPRYDFGVESTTEAG